MLDDEAMLLNWATHVCIFMKKLGIIEEFKHFLIDEQYKDTHPMIKMLTGIYHDNFVNFVEGYNKRESFFDKEIKNIDLNSMKLEDCYKVAERLGNEFIKREEENEF